jgi:hypothetical protein
MLKEFREFAIRGNVGSGYRCHRWGIGKIVLTGD